MKIGELIKIFLCLIFIMAVIFLVAMISSCTNQKTTTTVTGDIVAVDKRGKTITLKSQAKRVVVLFEPFVDQFYMLGAEEALVGIPQQIYQNASTFDFLSTLDPRIADRSIATPTFGGRSSNVESIVSLDADLAIVYEHDKETVLQLENLGIPVYVVSSMDKEHIYTELIGVGRLLGKEQRAQEIVDYVETAVQEMMAVKMGKTKKIYYAWSKGRVFSTSGKGSLIDLAMDVAGAENACPLKLDAPSVSAESLYKWNPDIVVLWNSELSDVYGLKELASLNAVRKRQVFKADPTFYYDPHTVKFLLFAKQLKQWCYPLYTIEAFQREQQAVLDFLYGGRLTPSNR